MKIVDRKTFLAMPEGTVYAKWGNGGEYPKDQDLTYGEVAVKGETVAGVDWVEETLMAWPEDCTNSGEWSDAMIAAINGAPTAPLRIGDDGGRDGLFEEAQLFAVFDRIEVERLVALFQNSLATAYADTALAEGA